MQATFTSRVALAFVLAVAGVVVAAPGPTAAQRTTPAQQRIITRILELQREVDQLLTQLPPGLRAQVREDLARPPTAGVGARPTTGTATTGVAATVGTERARSAPSSVDPFDGTGDGKLTNADPAWRALRIWTDANGDGTMNPGEVATVSTSSIREIDARLRVFVRRNGDSGSIRRADRIELDLRGDGFRSGAGILCLDIGSIADVGFEIRSARGQDLRGVQPLQAGWRVRLPDGSEVILR